MSHPTASSIHERRAAKLRQALDDARAVLARVLGAVPQDSAEARDVLLALHRADRAVAEDARYTP